jgi:hypothetical protein
MHHSSAAALVVQGFVLLANETIGFAVWAWLASGRRALKQILAKPVCGR